MAGVVLLIDNYDSYTYNIFHLLASEMDEAPIVIQNDDFHGDFNELRAKYADIAAIIIGPGPGNPNDSSTLGLSKTILDAALLAQIPIFGICLGMQAIALAFGGRVKKSPLPMHGRLSKVDAVKPCVLFQGLDFPLQVVRYHSLCVELATGNEQQLVITSVASEDGVAMSLQHETMPIHAVQFHPESICAGEEGRRIVANFLHEVCGISTRKPVSLAKQARLSASAGNARVVLKATKVSQNAKKTRTTSAEELFFHSSLFNQCEEGERMWMDSSSGLERGARYSILCSSSNAQLGERIECFVQGKRMRPSDTNSDLNQVEACVLRVNGEWREEQDFFAYLSQRIEALRPCAVELTMGAATPPQRGGFDLLPFDFACGFVGVLGYGLRKLCGVKPRPASSQKAFVPPPEQLPDAAFFLATRALVIDHEDGDAIYILTLVREDDNNAQEWTKAVLDYLASPASSSTLLPPGPKSIKLQSNRTREHYEADVHACLAYIGDGESYEICLTNQVKGQIPASIQLPALYSAIRQANPAPLSAFFHLGGIALLSSSPERFIRVDQKRVVESRPIKGTCKRALHDAALDLRLKQALLGSEKERSENLMIIDLVRNDLGRVCEVGTVQVPDLMVCETFATVHQLVSTVRGTLREDCDAVEACRACFPPGSMTGAPKLRTMQLIDEIEPEERGYYSGSLGFFSLNGAADFNVLIRTAVVVNGRDLSIGAGGAVVALSNAAQERMEMELKLSTLGDTFDINF